MIGRKKAENDVDHRGSGQNTETYRRESLYFSFSLAVLFCCFQENCLQSGRP